MFTSVLKNLRKSLSWLFYSAVGMYVFVFMVTLRSKSGLIGYQNCYCAADVFVGSVSKYFMYLFFLPLAVFVRQNMTKNTINTQLCLRLGNRFFVWKNKILYSVVVDFVFSVVIMLIIAIVAALLCKTKLNWDEMQSVYYMNCSDTNSEISFSEFLAVVFGYIYLTILSFDTVMQLTELYSSFSGWIIMVIYSGVNLRGIPSYYFYDLNYWCFENPKRFLVVQSLKLLIVAAAFLAGKRAIKNKDIYV